MRIHATMTAAHGEAVVCLEPTWLDRLIGRQPRTFFALTIIELNGGLGWWDDSRRCRVTDRRILLELEDAYWRADREERKRVGRASGRWPYVR